MTMRKQNLDELSDRICEVGNADLELNISRSDIGWILRTAGVNRQTGQAAPLHCRSEDMWQCELNKIKKEYQVLSSKLNIKKKWRNLDSLSHMFAPSSPTTPGSLRLMQWNVLARGLSQDGFFVNPVQEDWPVNLDRLPMITGTGSESVPQFIAKMQGVTKICDAEMRKELRVSLASMVETFMEDEFELDCKSLPAADMKLFQTDHDLAEYATAAGGKVKFLEHVLHLQRHFRGHLARNDTDRLKRFMAMKVELLTKIQKKFATPHLSRNSESVIDWDARWCRLRYQIAQAKPDILTLTEVDTLKQMQSDLALLGYECGFPGMKYCPMHATKDRSMPYSDFLQQSGIAYAPNYLSNALAICMGRTLDSKTFAAAAHNMMGAHLFEKVWTARSLLKDKEFVVRGGTRQLFQEMVKIDPATPCADTMDDDCSVIFWRRERFSLSQIHYLDMSNKRKHKSAVRVSLVDHSTGRTIQVMTTHLQSGTEPKDNKKRMGEIAGKAVELASAIRPKTTDSKKIASLAATDSKRTVSGVLGWYEDSCQIGPSILAMDANSSPQFEAEKTVWKSFALASQKIELTSGSGATKAATSTARKWHSVWDSYFDMNGMPKKSSSPMDPPVTVNKMRGTESEQPRKIGLHAYELIDHVWCSRGITFLGHAFTPQQYRSIEAATEQLIPDLVFPTDHFPVVVDMKLA